MTTLLFILISAERKISKTISSNSPTDDTQVCLGSRNKSGDFALVLGFDFLEGNDSNGLFVNDSNETSLALYDSVWDAHLAAKGR